MKSKNASLKRLLSNNSLKVKPLYPLFFTLTYANQDLPYGRGRILNKIVSDRGQFIRRLRKMGVDGSYLSGIEEHKSGVPHLHVLLLTCFDYRNPKHPRYVSDRWYMPLKSCWREGSIDIKVSGSHHVSHQLGYILKYISKTGSARRLWARILFDPKVGVVSQEDGSAYDKARGDETIWIKWYAYSCLTEHIDNSAHGPQCPGKWKKVKRLSWSRGFIEDVRSCKLYTAAFPVDLN